MTQDEIIEMANEAGLVSPYRQYKDWIEAGPSGEELVAFAKLVAAKEREECAKLCDELGAKDDSFYAEFSRSEDCAEAIRARGEA